MQTIDIQTTVGQLVAQRPGRSRFFERLGIDYCCGGKLSLEQACAAKGLDANTVAQTLAVAEADDSASATNAPDPAAMSLAQLADHIEATHHAYLRRETPRLGAMIQKVASVHGDRYPWTIDVVEVFEAFTAEISTHMMKEEQILFPMIRALESGDGSASGHCGGIANPIHVMEAEHDSAGSALAQMRELSNGFTPPADACNTFRAVLDGLAQLEADMHQHVHKENNILFPRALARESELISVGPAEW